MKLFTLGYQFGNTMVCERFETAEEEARVLNWAIDAGYKIVTREEEEEAVGQPWKEVYNLSTGKMKEFYEKQNHLL